MRLMDFLTEQFRADLTHIRTKASGLLARSFGSFTDHSIEHSDRIIETLDVLLADFMLPKTHDLPRLQPLNASELFVLMAAAYLHDVGMQQRKGTDDLAQVRECHHQLSYDMIVDSVTDQARSWDLGLDKEYVDAIAVVARGHRKADLLSKDFTTIIHGVNVELRVRLLAALLRLADELDITHQRVNIQRLRITDMPVRSQMHWWKHYFVEGIAIQNGNIQIQFRFPSQGYEDYWRVLPEVVFKAINEQCREIIHILWTTYGVKLRLSEDLDHHKFRKVQIETMPPEVMTEMKAYLREQP